MRALWQAATTRHSAASATHCQRRTAPSGIPRRVERDPVALAILHDCAAAVRSDRMHGLHHLAAVALDLRDRVANATIDVHVDENAAARGDRTRLADQAAAVAVAMIEHAEFRGVEFLLVHLYAEHCGVKRPGPVEVCDRDVEPDCAVVLRIEVGHSDPPWSGGR